MEPRQLDRMAAAVARGETRRGVAQVLGLSGLGALVLGSGLAAPFAAQAKRKKGKGKGKQDVNRLCKRQAGPCPEAVLRNCQLGPEVCQGLPVCCDRLKTCAFTEFILCLASRPGGSETLAASRLPFAPDAPSSR